MPQVFYTERKMFQKASINDIFIQVKFSWNGDDSLADKS